MRVRLLALLPAVAAVVALGIARADDGADQKKPAADAKKQCDDGCCGKDEKATKNDASAKKDDACEEGCCAKEKSAPVSAKQIECADCEKAKGPCAKCQEAVKSGAVAVLPIKGMACAACEGKVAGILDKIDAVAKFHVSSETNVAAVIVAPGRALKLSDVSKALEGTKFAVDEDAALHGRVTFAIDCEGCPECPLCPEGTKKDEASMKACADACSKKLSESLAKVEGVETVTPSTCAKTKAPLFTLQLAPASKVSIKQLRETVAGQKVKIADFLFLGAEESKKQQS
jgi:copper chaperone CopZ